MLRALFWGMVATLLVLFIWVMVPSSVILRPVAMQYDPATRTARFQRIVNWPSPVRARWAHTLYVLHTGDECSDDGIRWYSPAVAEETVGAPERLAPCLALGGPTVSVLTWSVLVLGFIPMRPTDLVIPAGAEVPR